MIASTPVGVGPLFQRQKLTSSVRAATDRAQASTSARRELPASDPIATSASRFAHDLCLAVPELQRIARRFINQDCLADDLVQLTCMRALERRQQFLVGTNLLGWLTTILRNLHRDELRRRRYQASLEAQLNGLTPAPIGPERPETPLWSHLGVEDVRRAAGALPAEMREAFLLYTFEDLSYLAIARKLGVPMATRLYRARLKLREVLSTRLDHPPATPPPHAEDARAESCSW
jgi:RNA polymerase sigma-70 factor (ECF subfamily)